MAAILQLLGVFGFTEMRREREKEGGREREPSLTVTQHYAAGQDGGGGSHKRGGDEEREEAQDAEVGEVFFFSIFLRHGLPVCHIAP